MNKFCAKMDWYRHKEKNDLPFLLDPEEVKINSLVSSIRTDILYEFKGLGDEFKMTVTPTFDASKVITEINVDIVVIGGISPEKNDIKFSKFTDKKEAIKEKIKRRTGIVPEIRFTLDKQYEQATLPSGTRKVVLDILNSTNHDRDFSVFLSPQFSPDNRLVSLDVLIKIRGGHYKDENDKKLNDFASKKDEIKKAVQNKTGKIPKVIISVDRSREYYDTKPQRDYPDYSIWSRQSSFTNWYKMAQSSRSFPPVLSRDEMVDFILENNLRDWQGKIDYNTAKDIAGWSKTWTLTEIQLDSFNHTADPDYKNKSKNIPPIVLLEDNGYDILDGAHRIGMAKARGEQTILVYLGDPDSWEQESTDGQNTKTASSVGKHKYTWVYIDLPKEIQKTIIDFGKSIDKEDLYVAEANKGLEDEPHITVKYGLTTENAKEVRECLEGAKKGSVYIGKSSIFSCEKFDVVKFTVESKALNKLHEMLNRLPHEDKHVNYAPHATVAYVKKGKGKKYVDKFKIDKSFKIDKCFFGSNTKDYSIKLSFNLARFLKKANGAINLWLDDERDPLDQFWWKEFPQLEQGGWTWAKTVEEAQPIVESGNVKFISFDNDLGTEKEGKHLAQWIEERAYFNELPRMGWEVHSKNTIAGPEIARAMQNADRFWDGHENL